MRLSNVEIQEVVSPITGINPSAKSLVLHLDDGSRFNILLGVGRQVRAIDGFQLAEEIFAPTRFLYEAHIFSNIFSICKNIGKGVASLSATNPNFL